MCPPTLPFLNALADATRLNAVTFSALNDAMQNGYDISTWPARDIALDLIAFSADHEDCTVEQLEPHCQA